MKKSDYLILLGLILILLIGIFIIQYYFKYQQDQCISNPFVYGSKQLKDRYNFEFVGYGFFKKEGYPTITFNSTSIYWKNP